MASQEPKKLESELPVVPAQAPEPPHDDTKSLIVAEKTPNTSAKKSSKSSLDRDIALAGVDKEKKLSFIKAWEESEKSKVENRTQKKLSDVTSWENTKKAEIESQLKSMEEHLEKKKAQYAEKMRNKIALIHKQAEEKRAMIEAKRGEDLLTAEELAAKHRATGSVPKKALGCFGV